MNCLDSTFLIDFLDDDRSQHERARNWMADHEAEPMYAPTVVRWELLRGATRLDGVDGIERLSTELTWLQSVPLTAAAATDAARIEAGLRSRGDEISAADYPIAGTARNAGATLVTADSDFERVDGLNVDRYDVDATARRG